MGILESWTRGEHTYDGVTHRTYREGSGPGVVVISEIAGITPSVVAFAEEVVGQGFTVVMPSLFGKDGGEKSVGAMVRSIASVCVSREFTILAAGQTSPVTGWLRSLARDLHADLGGSGVGAVGMCLTGGFALAMMVDPSVTAPVLAQPSLPACLGRRRAEDLGLSPEDLAAVKKRAAGGQEVLGLRFVGDPAVGKYRFDTLRRELGDAFLAVEFPGKEHSTLTEHRQQEGVDRVLAFFGEKLR